jgi:NitT/TauT family transport system substrate-binding protein
MTARGKLIFTILFLGLVVYGVSKWWPKLQPGHSRSAQTEHAQSATTAGEGETAAPRVALAETQFELPRLAPAGPYVPKDNVIELELSEYAGYAGLIAANGGLAPSENSIFFKKHGFKVKITLSEEESWSALNSGRMAGSATTADVLAIYGRQFQVVVPMQIGFSRGADGVVVRSDVKRINDLKGKTLVTAQFTEADFFIRYLAQGSRPAGESAGRSPTAADPEKVISSSRQMLSLRRILSSPMCNPAQISSRAASLGRRRQPRSRRRVAERRTSSRRTKPPDSRGYSRS